MTNIVWLASYPKSGNTWLRLFLANYFAPKRPLSLNQAATFAAHDSALSHFQSAAGGTAPDTTQACARLRPIVQRQLAAAGQGGVSFVKTHNACVTVAGAPLITPEVTAGAILIVRNPFDVAVSFAHHNDMPLSRAADALCLDTYCVPADEAFVEQYPTSWRRFYRSWTAAAGLSPLILRYEDMVRAPAASFAKVLAFLRLPPDESRLREAMDATRFDTLAAQERTHGFAEGDPSAKSRFFREGRIGGWKAALSPDQVAQIAAFNRDEMVRFGYADKAGQPVPVAVG